MFRLNSRILVFLAFLSVFSFWFVLSKDNYFHWDEWDYLTHFNDVRTFISKLPNEQFNLLHIFHHYLLFSLFGLNYLPFQLSSSFFHAVNSFLLYKIINRETGNRKLAIIAMGIFGFSSVSVENLNNSAAISQVFAGTFASAAYLFFLKFKDKRSTYRLALSSIFLVVSPMGHAITMLMPAAFILAALQAKITNQDKLRASIVYLAALLTNLLVANLVSGSRLTTNIKLEIPYFLFDVPNFVISGVLRGNVIRLFFPELHFFPLSSITIDPGLRAILRTLLHSLPLILLAIFLWKLRALQFRSKIISLLAYYLPLIIVSYVAAGPARATFGYNQAIITRYTYESFFFLLVLICNLLKVYPISPRRLTIGVAYLFFIHLVANFNFQTRYWQPIANFERGFIQDVSYLFCQNKVVYDLPASGIFPNVTLSKLWFLYPKDRDLVFLPAYDLPKDLSRSGTNVRSVEIYKKIISYYDHKPY